MDKFKSILEELSNYAPMKDRDLFIESRAQQVIASAINLVNLISENYDKETAEDLIKRMVRSITSGDENKFRRRIQAIRESKISK